MNRRNFIRGMTGLYFGGELLRPVDKLHEKPKSGVHVAAQSISAQGPNAAPSNRGKLVNNDNPVLAVRTMRDLRNSVGESNYQIVILSCFRLPADGGAGLFFWDPGKMIPDNGGTVIQPLDVKKGRWVRIYDGALRAEWFGASPSVAAEENAQALNRAIAACAAGDSVILPQGSLEIADTIIGKPGITLQGHYNNHQQLATARHDLVYSGPSGRDFISLSNETDAVGMTFVGLNVNGRSCSRVFNMKTVRGRWIDCVIKGGDVGIYLDSGKNSAWNGEHRIAGCAIEGQRQYGIQVQGRTAYDSFIESNVIYNYGHCGIYFGSSSQAPGWLIASNHIYSGPNKLTSSGKPKRTVEIHANATNFTLNANYLEGGTYFKWTTGAGIPFLITSNRLTLPDVANQIGIEVEVAGLRTCRVVISQNILVMNPGARNRGVGIRITKGIGAAVRGKIALNDFGDGNMKKYDFEPNPNLQVSE